MSFKIRIVSSKELSKRSYVCFYKDGKRFREFNGNNIGLDIKPNFASSISERDKLLRKLEHELLKALESEEYPKASILENSEILNEVPTTLNLLKNALDKKLNSSLSKFYNRNKKLLSSQCFARPRFPFVLRDK